MEAHTPPELSNEIDPDLLDDAMAVLASAGVQHLADVEVTKGGQTDTVLRGLALRIDAIAEADMTDGQIREYVENLVRKSEA